MPIKFLTAHDRVWLSCSQSGSLTPLTKQSARRGSQRTFSSFLDPGGMGVRPRQVSVCKEQAHSCGPVAFTPLCHSKALTQKLLNPDVSVLLKCKPLTNASCTASKSGASMSAFIISPACLSQYGAAEASTSLLVLTGSFIPLHQFVQLSIGNSAPKVEDAVFLC